MKQLEFYTFAEKMPADGDIIHLVIDQFIIKSGTVSFPSIGSPLKYKSDYLTVTSGVDVYDVDLTNSYYASSEDLGKLLAP